jgi:hypothetical protein
MESTFRHKYCLAPLAMISVIFLFGFSVKHGWAQG